MSFPPSSKINVFPSFKPQCVIDKVCKKEATDLINCVDQCLSLFQAWRQCVDKQAVCNKEATDLINCIDQYLSLFQAWRQCVDKKVKKLSLDEHTREADSKGKKSADSRANRKPGKKYT